MRLLIILILCCVNLRPTMGGGEDPAGQISDIQTVMKRYKVAKAIKMAVKKSVYLDLLEETKKSSGHLYFSRGRLRLDIEKPEQSMLLLADDYIWMENRMGEGDDRVIQVTKMKTSKDLKKSNALLAFLFGDEAAWEKFKVLSVVSSDSGQKFTLRPNKNNNLTEITKVEILINKKEKQLLSIIYWDELDNRTQYEFDNIDFEVHLKSDVFKYSPPKKADVQVL